MNEYWCEQKTKGHEGKKLLKKKKKKQCCKGSFFRLLRDPHAWISQKRKKKPFWTEWQHETHLDIYFHVQKHTLMDHAVVSDDAPDEFHSPCWQSLTTTTCRWRSPTQLALIQTWDTGRNIRCRGMSGFIFLFFCCFFFFPTVVMTKLIKLGAGSYFNYN